jgi:hypothetical protein
VRFLISLQSARIDRCRLCRARFGRLSIHGIHQHYRFHFVADDGDDAHDHGISVDISEPDVVLKPRLPQPFPADGVEVHFIFRSTSAPRTP